MSNNLEKADLQLAKGREVFNHIIGPAVSLPRSWTWTSRGVQKIQKLSETPATVHRVAKLCINDSKNRKNHEKLVQPVAPHLCMNPKPQKWPISKMSQTY